MAANKRVVSPTVNNKKNPIKNKTPLPINEDKMTVSFSKFKLSAVNIKKEFNNFFKDEKHFVEVSSGFIGTILPKITSHTYNEICEGSREGASLHFHAIDSKHQEGIRKVLEQYNFSKSDIDQMLEGDSIFECTASLYYGNSARVVCHKIDNVLEILFFDTNHHIYMKEKYIGNSFFYEDCPVYNSDNCPYMPGECFAVDYLDENKLRQSFGYDFDVTSS